MKKLLALSLFCSLAYSTLLNGQCCEPAEMECLDICADEPACPPRGKVDIGVAYVHVDVLFEGKTQHKIDVAAIKGDLHYRFWSGFILKPTFLFGGGHNDNQVATWGVGLGFCIPLCQTFNLTPTVGCNWGYLRTSFKIDHPDAAAMGIAPRLRERFRSQSPYIGFEASWTFRPCWRAVISYQYAWSRTHTTLRLAGIDPAHPALAPFTGVTEKDTNSHSHTKGSNISGMIEHDINANWSVNIGAAYNNSLSKEKHGLRAWGVKLGVAYWF
jgi:hypothetical protein